MQLVQKYNYADLKRQDGAVRLYLTPDGESLPSVTTVLSKTKDKSGLDRWRKRVGEKTAEKIIIKPKIKNIIPTAFKSGSEYSI